MPIIPVMMPAQGYSLRRERKTSVRWGRSGEVYATLTGLPVRPRITGHDGMTVLKQIRDRLTVISLTEQEYVSALESVSGSVVGGAAYDALIAKSAVKAGADVLLTWNLRDFTRFGAEIAQLVKTPIEI